MGLRERSFEKLSDKLPETNAWYVVYVSSRHEKKAFLRLADKKIEAYLPMVKKLRQWSDRKKWIDVPLFNGYLFVHSAPKQFDTILDVPGIVAFVKYNGFQATVRDKEIQTIKSLLAFGYDMESFVSDEKLTIGNNVLVTEGILKGQTGELLEEADDNWFVINIEGIGNSLKVKLPVNILKPIHE